MHRPPAVTALLYSRELAQATRLAQGLIDGVDAGLCAVLILTAQGRSRSGPTPLARLPGVASLTLPNTPPALAWNEALAITSSPYVALLPEGQTWRPGVLAAVHARAREVGAELAYAGWSAGHQTCMPPDLRQEDIVSHWLSEPPWPLGACLFSRTALARVGGLDPVWGDLAGHELLLRLGPGLTRVRHPEIWVEWTLPAPDASSAAERTRQALELAEIRARCLKDPSTQAPKEALRVRHRDLIQGPLEALATGLYQERAYTEALRVTTFLARQKALSRSLLWTGIKSACAALWRA